MNTNPWSYCAKNHQDVDMIFSQFGSIVPYKILHLHIFKIEKKIQIEIRDDKT